LGELTSDDKNVARILISEQHISGGSFTLYLFCYKLDTSYLILTTISDEKSIMIGVSKIKDSSHYIYIHCSSYANSEKSW